MATGINWEPGGVVAPTDWPDAGPYQWGNMTGMSPTDPLVGGANGAGNDNVTRHLGATIQTLPPQQQAQGGGTQTSHSNNWRDLLDFQGSPAPWLLLFTLAAIGLISGRAAFRAGPVRGSAGLG